MGSAGTALRILTSELGGDVLSASRLNYFTPRKGTTASWVAPDLVSAFLTSEKSLSLSGIEPRLLECPSRSLVTILTELLRPL